MTVGTYVVVPADQADPSQVRGKVALLNEDGTDWSPGESGGAPATVAWEDVTGKPTTFTPASHTHSIADIEGLQDILDGKADAE